jgi:hypothetical protein
MPIKSMVQDVKTRWNSTFLMLQRFIEQKEAIALFQTMDSGKNFTFSQDEWQLAVDVTKLLQPAFDATVEMSGELYVSGSKVIPLAKSLISLYAATGRRDERGDPSVRTALAGSMISSLNHHMGRAENVKCLALATLCDPRYKKEGFKNSEAASQAVRWLKEEMSNQPDSAQAREDDDLPPAAALEEDGSSLWLSFDREVSQRRNVPQRQNEDTVSVEVVKYLQMRNLPRTAKPLAWWDTVGKATYPQLYKVAQKMLVFPGTSVPSERVFSTAGGIITKKRSLLSDSTASNLIFLKENCAKKKKKE